MSSIPHETTYSAMELELLANEPAGLFPDGQDSLFGQIRKTIADYLQANLADALAQWWSNLDPRTVNSADLAEWEYMMGLPISTGKTDNARRAAIQSRMRYGAFTRAQRAAIVEAFLVPTLGAATLFTPAGIPFDAAGIPMFSGSTTLAGLYTITEDVANFSYTVFISVAVDTSALSRELRRITPAGISFSIVAQPNAGTQIFSKSGGGVARGVGGGTKNVPSTTGTRRAVVTQAQVQTP